MKQKRKFSKSLLRPIFNSLIGLIMLLSTLIGIIGYLEFADALKKQYIEITSGIAEYVALSIDAKKLDIYLETKTADDDYNSINKQIQHTVDAEDCSVIYVAKVHQDTKEREYIFNVVSKESGFTPYAIGERDAASDEILNAYDSILKGESDKHNFMYARKGYTTSVFPIKDDGDNPVFIVGVVKNMSLLNNAKVNYIIKILIIEVLIALISGLIWIFHMRRRIVIPIRKLEEVSQKMVEHLEDGSAPEIKIKNDDEIKDLAFSFSKMYGEIGEYIKRLETITAEKERIGAELNVASKIQTSMLPCIFPPFPNCNEFDIYATMDPAKEVGGDFYDFFMVDDDHLAFVVADVSGKGVPAALFMVIGKTLIKDHTGLHEDLGEVFTEVNNILCASNSEEMFITAFEGVLNIKTGLLRYVNAGHEMPFICKGNGAYEQLKIKPGFVLAGFEGIKYKSGSVQLEPGDKLFQYSDGVPEAINSKNEQYGIRRLCKVLSQNSDKTPSELLPIIKADLDNFVGEVDQFDDITMLCIKYNGKTQSSNISIIPDNESIKKVIEFIENTLEEWEIPMKIANKVELIVDEIYSNIVYYSQAKEAKVTLKLSDNDISIIFEDDGILYDPVASLEPDVTLPYEERDIGGLGIFMVKKIATKIDYKYENNKNILTTILNRKGE